MGSVTSGDFCGESDNDGQAQLYTVYFDIVFNHPFTASQVITESGQTDPDSVFLTFNTTSNPVIDAKVGISYVSTANAKQNWQTENPGWNFGAVQSAAQADWNKPAGPDPGLRRQLRPDPGVLQPAVQGLPAAQHHQRRQRPVHGLRHEGAHAGAAGRPNQYGIFSGWDIYHSLAQLQAMLDPAAASDMAQSLVNYYAENGILQQWGYLNLDNYVMVGDPSDSIIADYYAFGARSFNTTRRADRHAQAGHHGQRRAAGRGAGAEVRLPARGRHLRLLQPARPGAHAAGVRHRGLRPVPVRHGAGRHRRRDDAPATGRTTG